MRLQPHLTAALGRNILNVATATPPVLLGRVTKISGRIHTENANLNPREPSRPTPSLNCHVPFPAWDASRVPMGLARMLPQSRPRLDHKSNPIKRYPSSFERALKFLSLFFPPALESAVKQDYFGLN